MMENRNISKKDIQKVIKINHDNFILLLDYFSPFFGGNKELASNNIFLLDKHRNIK